MYKKLTATMFALAMLFAAALCVHADDLGFVTAVSLPKATFDVPYSTTITAQGGSGNYTYSVDPSAYIPSGLTLSSNGVLSGTPQEGGKIYGKINIVVTDTTTNETAMRSFSLSIVAQKLEFKIGTNSFTFDSLPHTVTAEPYLNGTKVEGIDYDIKVGGAENQTNVGSYPIKITVNTPGYKLKKMDKSHLFINYNNNVNIEFSGDTEYAYTGGQKTPTATVTGKLTDESDWTSIAHTIHYDGLNVSYSSDTPPNLPGVYRMTVSITEPGFYTPSDNDIQFQILHNTVNFNISDNSPFYYGQTWNRTYDPDKTLTHVATVKYVQDGTEYDAPVSGTYSVRVTLADEDAVYYSIGTVSPSTITVQQRIASFTVTDTEKEYTGSGLSPNIVSDDGLTANTDYTVTFANTDSSDTTAYDLSNLPVNSGTYTYTIELASGSTYTMTPVTGTFTIKPMEVVFTVTPTVFKYNGTTHTPSVTAKAKSTDANIDASLYTVKYLLDETESEVKNHGDYTVSVDLTDKKNYTVSDDSTKTVTVSANPIDFTIENNTYTYDGTRHGATVTAKDSDENDFDKFEITYTNTDSSDTTVYDKDNLPQNAGTYTININLTDSEYSMGNITGSQTLTISKAKVDFTITDNTYGFAENTHRKATVTAKDKNNDTFTAFTVAYTNTNTSDTTNYDNDTNSPVNAGTYNIVITLTDTNNYETDTITGTQTLTINAMEIAFTLTEGTNEVTYDGNAHTATITTSPVVANPDDVYEVTYKKQGSEDAATNDVTNRGVYDIIISIKDTNYTRSDSNTFTMTVNPREVTFSVTNNNVDYDGTAHNATVTVNSIPAVADPEFTWTYTNQDTTDTKEYTTSDAPVNAGVYDINIILNDNYVLNETYTLTINTSITMNYGNSPAAKIYLDTAHSSDTDWQTAALEYFKANRHFSDEYLPAGCRTDINYPELSSGISPTMGDLDFDGNPYTVIVPYSLDNFVDPGVSINGVNRAGTISSDTYFGIEGLYQVTYTDDDDQELGKRFVIIAYKTGDTNADGVVNAVDANVLRRYIASSSAAEGIIKARSWDVNKDGSINGDDQNAVLNRFRTTIVPFYPWIEF